MATADFPTDVIPPKIITLFSISLNVKGSFCTGAIFTSSLLFRGEGRGR